MRLLITIFFIIPLCAVAQPPQQIICRHLNNRNGLMHGPINAMRQDKNGFIWLAGDEGLQRYDGYEFVSYFHNPNKAEHTFPNGRLESLSIDSNGRLWIGSFFDGFGWYDAYHNFNKNYRLQSQPLLNSDDIGFRDFLFVNDSAVFACGSGGLTKLVNDSIVKTYTPLNSPLQGGLVGRIAKDKNNNIWIGTVDGLNFLSADEKYLYNHTNNKSITAFQTPSLKEKIGNKPAIAEMMVDGKNNLWVSTWEPALYKYDIDRNTLEKITLTQQKKFVYDNMVLALEEDNDGNVWIGTANNGLYKYSYADTQFQHFNHRPDDVQSIGTDAINELMKDDQGNIWIAGDNIVSVFNPSYHLIETILPNTLHPISATLLANDKTIWAADIEWLYHFDAHLSLLKKYRHQSNINAGTQVGNVWGLKESIDQKEIFIRRDNGISIFNKQTGVIDLFKDISILSNNPVTDIIELEDGNFYLCRWWWAKNLLFMDRKNRVASIVALPVDDKNNFEISTAIKKTANEYYLFSKKGLMLLNTVEQKVSMLDAAYTVGRSIQVDDKFYSVTATNGIKVYDIHTKKISGIGKYEGLPANNTKCIAYAGNNIFWIGSSSGLIKWNSSNNTFTRVGEDEGIDNPSIYSNSLIVTDDGKIVFSNGSLLLLDTARWQRKIPFKASIISCIAGDSLLTPSQLDKAINISYANNIIQIRFAAINNLNGNVRYEYMLEGYDDVWKDGSLRFVNYTNLPHGSYTFKVRVAGDDGIWNNDVTAMKFHVSQAFYKAWWFYLLLTVLLLAAVLFYYRTRINRILELQKLRNNISRDLHDEVGSTLSSISILSTSVIQNMEQEPAKTKEWVQQIGRYAQHMLNVMDDIVWAINPRMDGFSSVVGRMREVAYSTTEAADVKVLFEYDEHLNTISLPMLTKRNLYLIFKEAVNNAVKHAACKRIDIVLHKRNNSIYLSIKDDGIGFDTNKEVNRNGLKNIRQRVTEIQGEISLTSKKGEGTMIELNIPF
jgi:ligand-binding sensor domain-containing protein/two-component sensor histidine kinase